MSHQQSTCGQNFAIAKLSKQTPTTVNHPLYAVRLATSKQMPITNTTSKHQNKQSKHLLLLIIHYMRSDWQHQRWFVKLTPFNETQLGLRVIGVRVESYLCRVFFSPLKLAEILYQWQFPMKCNTIPGEESPARDDDSPLVSICNLKILITSTLRLCKLSFRCHVAGAPESMVFLSPLRTPDFEGMLLMF